MIVTLKGMPDGKDLEYETGFPYFIDTVRLRIAEHNPPDITPGQGAMPVNTLPVERVVVFCFSHEIPGRYIYTAAPK